MQYRSFFSLLLSLVAISLWIDACNNSPSSPHSGFIATSSPIKNNVVTTLAGSAGVTGVTNAKGVFALFNGPSGVAIDASGNIYVADANNSLIRKINSGGVVSTLAGTGSVGSVNGTGTVASFNYPAGVAVDTSGNVYVTDTSNNLIRQITSKAVVTTLAGSGSQGSANGTGTAASFSWPFGVAIDSSGNIYVGDQSDCLVRKITSGGVVTTIAGSGACGAINANGTAASFCEPFGVAVDSSRNVYVADAQNDLIRKITSGGVVTTLAGSAGVIGATNATGTAASFNNPQGVAVDDAGNVYVADSGNDLIRIITSAGVVTTLAGSAGVTGAANGPTTTALFNNPTGVAVDSFGNVYIADYNNDLIREIQ
jgi:sugar lactone lactonase YvrE